MELTVFSRPETQGPRAVLEPWNLIYKNKTIYKLKYVFTQDKLPMLPVIYYFFLGHVNSAYQTYSRTHLIWYIRSSDSGAVSIPPQQCRFEGIYSVW